MNRITSTFLLLSVLPSVSLAANYQEVIKYREMVNNVPEDKFHNTIKFLEKDEEEIGRTGRTIEYMRNGDVQIKPSGNATVWTKSVSIKDRPKDKLIKGDIVKTQMEVNCDTYEMAILAQVVHRKTETIRYEHFPNPIFSPVVPDTFGASFANRTCLVKFMIDRLDKLGLH
ncbi:hypothetical protein R7J20_16750 [Acinetobacter baumannii]|nr:hypothetical protein [Acinetobacter baumannii]MDW5349538.1 hypothetical protein [Acinetobacter baumannii]MDW5367036.1 hypothetical protein [Acinetobacter baumannii]MDW5382299.1 hypothetical protein [Acinetobacter baumannii]